jgi:hypothetical protein
MKLIPRKKITGENKRRYLFDRKKGKFSFLSSMKLPIIKVTI